MGYNIYLQRFENADAAPMDDATARALLAPYVVQAEPSFHRLRIQMADGGEADVYTGDGSLMFARFAAGEVLDLVAEIASRLRAVILLPEGVAILGDEDDRRQLPEELRREAVVVDLSGAAVEAVIRAL